jgi:DNA repair protein RadC
MNTNTTHAARLAAEDAAWEARGKMAARERVAEQVANLDDATLDLLREQAHTRRRNLVNLYIGDDRKALIEEEDLIIGVIEEEQAERAGLASSEDILASFGAL